MPRVKKGWWCLSLTLGLLVGSLPAEASEVVKLARLVVSGKRGTTEAPKAAAPTEQRQAPAAPQAHGNGGNDDAGTAPAPARGLVS